MFRTAVPRIVAILAAASACAAISNVLAGPERRLNWVSSGGGAMRSEAPAARRVVPSPAVPAATPGSSARTDQPWKEISGPEVDGLFPRGAIFFDARRTAEYRAGHIPGARPFSVWEADLDAKIRGFFAEGPDPSTPLVVYCSGGECEDSHTLAQKLYLAGFDHVLVYREGFPDWAARGRPVKTGDSP